MKVYRAVIVCICIFFASAFGFLLVRTTYPRPYAEEVQKSGLPSALVYAVMKAESNFREGAESDAGAVGIMQLLPSTAAFVCEREGISFDAARLTEGEYNVTLGCAYLGYLMEEFEEETALAAYNAGEGRVREWLKDGRYSSDGRTLKNLLFPKNLWIFPVLKLDFWFRML